MQLEGDHPCAPDYEMSRYRAGPRSDVQNEVPGLDPGANYQPAGPGLSELVVAPIPPRRRGHGAPSPWSSLQHSPAPRWAPANFGLTDAATFPRRRRLTDRVASRQVTVDVPAWVPGRTFYHLHSFGAAGGRGISQLERWLDHVASLGCGGILMTPVHHSSSHGYDTIDPCTLDPRLGTESDFEGFTRACRERGLRLILDGVFNHVGTAFPRTEWLSGASWEGHENLRELDHGNPEVLDWAIEVCRSWLDRGCDGWRIDVAYRIPHPFLRALASAVRSSHPDAFVFGEMIHGDYPAFVRDTGLHAVTQYELYKAIWSSLNDRNFWELAWALDRHRSFAETFPPVTFVGNHDVTRIASALTDRDHLELALTILFTVPGVPCVYYGDEFAWRGLKQDRPGGDDDLRPPLPDSPLSHPAVEEHERWIAFRRSRPWLTGSTLEVLDKTNSSIDYRVGDLTVHIDLDDGVRLEES